MLERAAAAKLEPCAWPRPLPSTVKPRRRLHTAFWQHGAAAIDLSATWTQSLHGHPGRDGDSAASTTAAPDRLFASAFLFDFLYPKGTAAFLRRLATAPATRNHRLDSRSLHDMRRSYISASYATASAIESSSLGTDLQSLAQPKTATPAGAHAALADRSGGHSLESLQRLVDPQAQTPMSALELIAALMERTDTEFFDPLWALWNMTESKGRPARLWEEVVTYLARSANPRDARRVIYLLEEQQISSWTAHLATLAVAAHLRMDDVDRAFDVYRNCLEDERSLVAGMGHLLERALRLRDWDMACYVWRTRVEAAFRSPSPSAPARDSGEPWDLGDLSPLTALQDLGGRVVEFAEFISATQKPSEKEPDHAPPMRSRPLPEFTGDLLERLAALAIAQPCRAAVVVPLLRLAGPSSIHDYITAALARGDTGRLREAYREYQKFSGRGFRPDTAMIHGLFEVLRRQKDVPGLRALFKDWERIPDAQQDMTGRRLFRGFFALRGNVQNVQKLSDAAADEHGSHNHDGRTLTLSDRKDLMRAHSARGDLAMVHHVFDDLASTGNLSPDIDTWNTLLHAEATLGAEGGVAAVYARLVDSTNPNSGTFETMMAAAGYRGDVRRGREIWQMARERSVATTVGMVACMVDAFLKGGKFGQARRLCIKSTRTKTPGDHAKLWNRLLAYKSHERDFIAVHRTMQEMRALGIEWNWDTQAELLQVLIRSRKSAQAYQYLSRVIDEGRFPFTEKLCLQLLNALWRRREWPLVLGMCSKMRDAGIPVPPQASLAADQARANQTGIRRDRSGVSPDLGARFVAHYQDFPALIGDLVSNGSPRRDELIAASFRQPGGLLEKAKYVNSASAVLALIGDVASMRKLLSMYRADGESIGVAHVTPLPILESMMRADLLEDKLDQVKQTWKLAVEEAVKQGRSPPGSKRPVLAIHQYALDTAFGLAHRAFCQDGNPEAAFALIEDVGRAGFELSSLQWNHVCLALAQGGQWARACELCETKLMQGWRGWRANAIRDHSRTDVGEQLLGTKKGYMRPNARMLVVLAQQYRARRRLGVFDAEARMELARVQKKCPRTMLAFKTMASDATHEGGQARRPRTLKPHDAGAAAAFGQPDDLL